MGNREARRQVFDSAGRRHKPRSCGRDWRGVGGRTPSRIRDGSPQAPQAPQEGQAVSSESALLLVLEVIAIVVAVKILPFELEVEGNVVLLELAVDPRRLGRVGRLRVMKDDTSPIAFLSQLRQLGVPAGKPVEQPPHMLLNRT